MRCHSYGPTITTLSPLLSEVLNLYLDQVMVFDAVEDDTPYLFHPQNTTNRCIGSSQWTQLVKAAFQKHAGKPVPPKSLRSRCALACLSLFELTRAFA